MIAHALEVFDLRPRKYRNAQLVDFTAGTTNSQLGPKRDGVQFTNPHGN
jgi:hypothetical protein